LRQGRLKEAERSLLEAESLLSKVFGPASPRVLEARTSLAETYARLGRPEQAAEWRRKAESPPPAPDRP
jgi:hypothetical protein